MSGKGYIKAAQTEAAAAEERWFDVRKAAVIVDELMKPQTVYEAKSSGVGLGVIVFALVLFWWMFK